MFSIDIVNTPERLEFDPAVLATIGEAVSSYSDDGTEGVIAVACVEDERMRELNALYRGKDSPTDVLSFRYSARFDEADATVGDIVISPEYVARQASEYEVTEIAEAYTLVLHGCLHILGYDHETDEEYAVMSECENAVKKLLLEKHSLVLR
jgi:rRNA maturation RNase YbeY